MIELPVKGKNKIYQLSPSKIIAIGKNYLDHIKEHTNINVSKFDDQIPAEPVLFAITPNALIANGESIVIPSFLKKYNFASPRVDYEAELAFVISRKCKNVREEDAYNYIEGFTCFNDVSQRNIQKTDISGWFRAKSLDTFAPVGPCLVPLEEIGDPQNLRIQCRLNGRLVQDSNTKHMIFNIKQIISFISMNFTLEAGDLVATGTPSGVGAMKHGDIVEVEIEKIGIIKNPVIEE
ncbi:MAG TPA: fumarylacetoacetate hydrolase family protein [Victivallales bacterium]|nr:fumarylacetoacetate hydrolase family protein [Victivallales bacterium]HPO91490.1 fumarylacetoacetate hydrolase family protein [Victivallales bacterium]HRR29242.1 fumarylacetoacetate hydrolase family protein [Victivallales bacterium]HRU00837.1 fumarylacetoacetate hydrolase family protein [Victivallales bacterium]